MNAVFEIEISLLNKIIIKIEKRIHIQRAFIIQLLDIALLSTDDIYL